MCFASALPVCEKEEREGRVAAAWHASYESSSSVSNDIYRHRRVSGVWTREREIVFCLPVFSLISQRTPNNAGFMR